jgi:hypothetical protein
MTLWKLQALILCAVFLVFWGFSVFKPSAFAVSQACASPNLDEMGRRACQDIRGF